MDSGCSHFLQKRESKLHPGPKIPWGLLQLPLQRHVPRVIASALPNLRVMCIWVIKVNDGCAGNIAHRKSLPSHLWYAFSSLSPFCASRPGLICAWLSPSQFASNPSGYRSSKSTRFASLDACPFAQNSTCAFRGKTPVLLWERPAAPIFPLIK